MQVFAPRGAALLASLLIAPPALALEVAQTFQPAVIGPGSTSRLEYTLTNSTGLAQTGIAFANTLPAGVALAPVAVQENTCQGQLSAPAGGDTVSFGEGRLGLGQSCRIAINVLSSNLGPNSNVTSSITSDSGSFPAGPAADLTVDASLPGWYVDASPAVVDRGDVVALTYTVDNSQNASDAVIPQLRIALPRGVALASGNAIDTDCSVTMSPGEATEGTVLSASGAVLVSAGTTCSLVVDVRTDTPGALAFVTQDLLSGSFASDSSGFAMAAVQVTQGTLDIAAGYNPVNASPGETVSLGFELNNTDRRRAASAVSFSYDLTDQLAGLSVAGSTTVQSCGGNLSTNGGVLELEGGSLAAAGSCRIEVPVQVPSGAVAGLYTGMTSALSATLGGSPVSGNRASTQLSLADRPVWQKAFLEPVVAAGDEVTLRYTLSNTSDSETLGNLVVQEALHSVDYLGQRNDCDAIVNYLPSATSTVLNFSLNQLPPSSSCEVEVDLRIPAGTRSGTLELGTVSALYDDTRPVKVLTDTLEVVAGPDLQLAFEPATALPGDRVELVATLGAGPATDLIDQDEYEDYDDVALSLDLGDLLTGLVATDLPPAQACGDGARLSGSDTVVLGGGSLPAGTTCRLRMPLQVPAGAGFGSLEFEGQQASAQVRGYSVSGAPASARLSLAGASVRLTQSDPLPAAPGDTARVTVEVQNLSPDEAVDSLGFQLDYDAELTSLLVPTVPADGFCGAGSTVVAGTAQVNVVGLTLGAGERCAFELAFAPPAGTASGYYAMPLSDFTYVIQGQPVAGAGSLFSLEVLAAGEVADTREETPAEVSDPDGDGLSTEEEWPLGDVNGDGIRDALQGEVASIVSPVTGSPVALAFDPGCQLTAFSMVAAGADGGNAYPEGLADFTLNCSRSDIVLYLPGMDFSAGNLGVRKYGPRAPAFGRPEWYPVAATVDAASRSIAFTLVDGQLGDSTGVDGRLVDPVGLALLAATPGPGGSDGGARAVPVNQPWLLVLLVLAVLKLAATGGAAKLAKPGYCGPRRGRS